MTHTNDIPTDLVPHGHRWNLVAAVAGVGAVGVATAALFVVALAVMVHG